MDNSQTINQNSATHTDSGNDNFLVNNINELSVLTHELRNPLNGLLALTDVLSSTILDTNQSRIVKDISTSADTLHRMIEQVLDYSKLTINSSVEKKLFNIKQTIDRIYSTFHTQSESKNILLKYISLNNFPDLIFGDEIAVEHILINVLSNCINYTDSGYIAIYLSTSKEADGSTQLEIEIEDTGIGMSEDFLNTIYDPFVQEHGLQSGSSGIGLGMTITKKYIRRLEGTIDVTSEPGIGTNFHITFPVTFEKTPSIFQHAINVSIYDNAVDENIFSNNLNSRINTKNVLLTESTFTSSSHNDKHDVDIIKLLDRDDYTKLKNIFLNKPLTPKYNLILLTDDCEEVRSSITYFPYKSITLLPLTEHSLINDVLVSMSNISDYYNAFDSIQINNLPPRHALIADDDRVSQLALKLKLQECNITSNVVNNGFDALLRLKENHYDIVLLDINMPQLTGIDVLKNMEFHQDMKVVLLSALDTKEQIDTCFNNGADAFFMKPIKSDFTSKITSLLNDSSTDKALPCNKVLNNDDDLLLFKFPSDIFNTDMLRQSLCSGHDYTKDILLLFISTSSSAVRILKACIKNKDDDLCQHYAHKLRSSSQQSSIHVFENILSKIESSNDKNKTLSLTQTFIEEYIIISERINLVLSNVQWATKKELSQLIMN